MPVLLLALALLANLAADCPVHAEEAPAGQRPAAPESIAPPAGRAGTAAPTESLNADIEPLRECDRLAADPHDVERPAGIAGVALADIEAERAVPACEKALAAEPKAARIVYQLARALDAGGRDADALKQYRAAAEGGHAAAQFNLGTMYAAGDGMTADGAQALAWYRRAAEQGSVDANWTLGWMHVHGQGDLKPDVPKGVDLMLSVLADDEYFAHRLAREMFIAGRGEAVPDRVRREVQRQLKQKGFYAGEIDGRFGPGTLRALQAFADAKGGAPP